MSGTVAAGAECKIRLTPVKTETVLLTMTLNAGQTLNVKINGSDKKFTAAKSEVPGKAVYVLETAVTERVNEMITLSADTETGFSLKAESVMTEAEEPAPAGIPETEEPAAEEAAAEQPAEEETETEKPAEEVPAEEETVNEEPAAEEETESEEPAAEEPTAEEPAAEGPETKEPAEEAPAEESISEEPAAEEETKAEAPAEETPATEEPAAEEPAAEEPAAEGPSAAEKTESEEAAEQTFVSEAPAEETEAEEPAAEEPAEGTPVSEEPAADETAIQEPAAEETIVTEAPAEETKAEDSAAEEPETEPEPEDPDLEMLENGYVKVMVIRENGTNLYSEMDANADAAGSLNHGDVAWIRAVGGMWGEVYTDTDDSVLFLNLNNVALLKGEVEYNIPIRKVHLTSTLDGLTEVQEGTEIFITAEFSGFTEDEIAEITWQYRTENDEEGIFFDIEDAHDTIYSYFISAENVHNEWRIVLTLKS